MSSATGLLTLPTARNASGCNTASAECTTGGSSAYAADAARVIFYSWDRAGRRAAAEPATRVVRRAAAAPHYRAGAQPTARRLLLTETGSWLPPRQQPAS